MERYAIEELSSQVESFCRKVFVMGPSNCIEGPINKYIGKEESPVYV